MIDPIKLKRHSDENLKQWKLRICENYKEYGLSNWNEVAEVINKETGEKKVNQLIVNGLLTSMKVVTIKKK